MAPAGSSGGDRFYDLSFYFHCAKMFVAVQKLEILNDFRLERKADQT